MEFFVRGYDGTDEGSKARRDAARPTHLELAARMAAEGRFLYTAAILDEGGRVTGSAIFCDFPSRKELDEWLAMEPLVTFKAWQRIEVERCMPGKAFAKKRTE